jgi:hypothetical protein
LFVYLEKERFVTGAGKSEGWQRRGMKKREVKEGSISEGNCSP